MNKRKRVLHSEHFEVLPSTIKGAGRGLFARIPIKKGETIGAYTGEILTDEEANSEPYVDSDYILWVCADCNILGEGPQANYTRYINHSSKPNGRIVASTRWKKARIEAIKAIKAGQEIFIDYGEAYWQAREYNESLNDN